MITSEGIYSYVEKMSSQEFLQDDTINEGTVIELQLNFGGDSTPQTLQVPYGKIPEIMKMIEDLGAALNVASFEKNLIYIQAFSYQEMFVHRIFPKEPLLAEGKISPTEKEKILETLGFQEEPFWFNLQCSREGEEETWYTVTHSSYGIERVENDLLPNVSQWERCPEKDIEETGDVDS